MSVRYVGRYGGEPFYSDLAPPSQALEKIGALLREGGAPAHLIRPYDPATYLRLRQLDEEDRQSFVRYCEELDCLHEDMEFILFDLEGAVTLHYRNSLDLKRLALVYHEDNFYFRLHAYKEKLLKLINHGFGFKIPDRPGRSKKDPPYGFHNEVRTRLKQERLGRLVNLVNRLGAKGPFPEALRRRNMLAHSLAPRDPTWPTMSTRQRVIDWVEVREEIDAFDKLTDLDRLYEKKQKELGAVKKHLDQFRRDFVTALQKLGF